MGASEAQLRAEERESERLVAEHSPVLVAELLSDGEYRFVFDRWWRSRASASREGMKAPEEEHEQRAATEVVTLAAAQEGTAPGLYPGEVVARAAGLLEAVRAQRGLSGVALVKAAFRAAGVEFGRERRAVRLVDPGELDAHGFSSTETFGGEAA